MAVAQPLAPDVSTGSLLCVVSPTAIRQQEQTPLEALLAACPTCFLQPFVFFVSWQGVLTLAFSGFPPALVELKSAMAEACPELPPENHGSKWPKARLDFQFLLPLFAYAEHTCGHPSSSHVVRHRFNLSRSVFLSV